MKQPFLLAILAISTVLYFHNRIPPTPPVSGPVPAAPTAANPPVIIVASAPSSYSRWKTGPNAQTEFDPFTPNEQASWNQ